MPDVTFAKKEMIPEELQKDAKEVNGQFVVNLVLNSTLKEFRDSNIEIRKAHDTLAAKLAPFEALGIEDPAKFKDELPQLRQTAQMVADGKLQGTDAIAREVDKRVAQASKDKDAQLTQLQTQLAAQSGKRQEAEAKFQDLSLTQRITEAARHKDSPVNPEAVADIVSRARTFGWSTDENGNLVAKRNGQSVLSEKDPAKALDINEWLGGVVKTAPYLGKGSAGGGAGGGNTSKEDYLRSEAFLKLSPADRITKAREMGSA